MLVISSLWGCAEDAPPPRPPVERPAFDGQRALALVEAQLAFGPRVPGTEGHQRQLAWMLDTLDPLADEVLRQDFDYETTSGETLSLTNVIARFSPEADRRILLLTHWDTRPTSDQESDPEARALPVPGANDGGSGTAVLLVLAELLSRQSPPLGVDLLFVDGEDYGPTTDDMFIGARHFADEVSEEMRPMYGVLLDMVGDADPSFPIEGYSAERATQVAQRVWRVARDLGYGRVFEERVGQAVQDDHLPLIQAGIPTINVIDFDYGPDHAYWHTAQDDLANVSARTLGMVGEVMAELIYRGG